MAQVPDKIPTLAELVAIRDGMVADLKDREAITDRLYSNSRRFDFSLNMGGYSERHKDRVQAVDIGFWRWVLEHTGITGAMTEKAKSEYLDRLEKKPPAFTLKALGDLAQNADRIYSQGFEQTIAEVRRTFLGCHYEGGDWRHGKKDNLQRIEKQFRSRGPIYWDTIMQRFYLREGGKFEDLLTACLLLDGQPRTNYSNSFRALGQAQIQDDRGDTVVTPYFTVKAHKNGNHRTTWNPDKEEILDRLNSWGLDGSTLGDSMRKRYKAEHFPDGGFDISQAGEKFNGGPDAQFYPTPPELVARLLEYAEIRPGLRWLEPEVGDGAIALAILQANEQDIPQTGLRGFPIHFQIQGFEIDAGRAQALAEKNLTGLAVKHTDFLKVKPEDWAKFDRIVMNPPFSRQADAIHVLHALRFLAPDGGLVAVMGASIESSQTRTAKALRAAVQARGGRFEENPSGTFKAAGTMVRTVTLVIPPKSGAGEA